MSLSLLFPISLLCLCSIFSFRHCNLRGSFLCSSLYAIYSLLFLCYLLKLIGLVIDLAFAGLCPHGLWVWCCLSLINCFCLYMGSLQVFGFFGSFYGFWCFLLQWWSYEPVPTNFGLKHGFFVFWMLFWVGIAFGLEDLVLQLLGSLVVNGLDGCIVWNQN